MILTYMEFWRNLEWKCPEIDKQRVQWVKKVIFLLLTHKWNNSNFIKELLREKKLILFFSKNINLNLSFQVYLSSISDQYSSFSGCLKISFFFEKIGDIPKVKNMSKLSCTKNARSFRKKIFCRKKLQYRPIFDFWTANMFYFPNLRGFWRT